LQHKYSSTLVYSQDRIVEASQFRKKIQNFVYSIDSTLKIIERLDINHKPSSDSMNLSESFNKCKVSTRNALADDFDTPTALKHLSHLIAHTSDYINRINQSITSQVKQKILFQV
jgi:cysteinyl-tRNA synthetase